MHMRIPSSTIEVFNILLLKYSIYYLYKEYKSRYTLLDSLPEAQPRVSCLYSEYTPIIETANYNSILHKLHRVSFLANIAQFLHNRNK